MDINNAIFFTGSESIGNPHRLVVKAILGFIKEKDGLKGVESKEGEISFYFYNVDVSKDGYFYYSVGWEYYETDSFRVKHSTGGILILLIIGEWR